MEVIDNFEHFKHKNKGPIQGLPGREEKLALKTVKFIVKVDVTYSDDSVDSVGSEHSMGANQLFTMPQGPMFLLSTVFNHMMKIAFEELVVKLTKVYSKRALGFPEESPIVHG